MELRAVQPDDLHGGLRSTGSHRLHLQVHAFCQCGWTGPQRPWDSLARDAERAELAAHLADSGHHEFPIGVPPPEGYHHASGHFHWLNDACPVPGDSPAGVLERIVGGSTIGRPARALDRLSAINQMRAGLDDEETQAAIGARMAGCTWPQMGQAIGANADSAIQRWGQMIGRYQHAGLLPPHD
jgi:hypothetical protein